MESYNWVVGRWELGEGEESLVEVELIDAHGIYKGGAFWGRCGSGCVAVWRMCLLE